MLLSDSDDEDEDKDKEDGSKPEEQPVKGGDRTVEVEGNVKTELLFVLLQITY